MYFTHGINICILNLLKTWKSFWIWIVVVASKRLKVSRNIYWAWLKYLKVRVTRKDWKHMSVGTLGRGGVFLIPLDTDIPVAIHSTFACYSILRWLPSKIKGHHFSDWFYVHCNYWSMQYLRKSSTFELTYGQNHPRRKRQRTSYRG